MRLGDCRRDRFGVARVEADDITVLRDHRLHLRYLVLDASRVLHRERDLLGVFGRFGLHRVDHGNDGGVGQIRLIVADL